MSARLFAVATGIAVGALCAALLGVPQVRELEEQAGLRWLFNLRGPVAPPDEVAIVVMNQEAASNISLPRDAEAFHRCEDLRVGSRPATHVSLPALPSRWPRCVHARLVDRLAGAGASVIAFDVLFRPRPPLPGASGDLHAWQDDALAHALAAAGRVVIAQKIEAIGADETLSELSPVIAEAALGAAPFPLLAEPGRRVDRFMSFKESGFVTPTLPALALHAYAQDAYPILASLVSRASEETALLLPTTHEAHGRRQLQATSLLTRQIFRNRSALARQLLDATPDTKVRALVSLYAGDDIRLLNLYGPAGTIRSMRLDQALSSSTKTLASFVQRRAVFVGYAESAQPEQVEHFATVFSAGDGADLSGVETAATAFGNLLHNRTLRELPMAYWLALTFLAGALAYVACARLANRVALPIVAAALGVYGAAALFIFAETAVWIPVVAPLLIAAPAGALTALAWKYWTAHRQREHLRRAFSYFVPAQVVDMLERNAGQIEGSQESLECACVATDAANFTPLAEAMTPEQLTHFLNHYFEALFGCVAERGGFVSDVVGDAMLAIWPHRSGDTHGRVLSALLEMRVAAQRFNERLAQGRLMTRFGADWGRVALTTVGAHKHYEYRAVGEAVNTATRIQELNKKLGTSVLLSRSVIGNMGDDFLLRDLGDFLLRGKTHSVHLYELVERRAAATPAQTDLCARFADALQALNDGRTTGAIARFRKVQALFPDDGATAFYLRTLESGLSLQEGALVAD